jgi:hypothetical protein
LGRPGRKKEYAVEILAVVILLRRVHKHFFNIVGLLIALTFALAIVSVIFAPAIMRTLDQRRLATLPQPSATASPSLAETIKSAVAKKITDELKDELSGKKNTAVEPAMPTATPRVTPKPRPTPLSRP